MNETVSQYPLFFGQSNNMTYSYKRFIWTHQTKQLFITDEAAGFNHLSEYACTLSGSSVSSFPSIKITLRASHTERKPGTVVN
jgi:hypothetical protein